MSRDRLLALDLGTTRVCALVVDAGGAIRGRATRALDTRYPAPGRVEQDPLQMWERSVEVMRAALAASGDGAEQLAGLGVTTQRATALAWDAATREPLAPALVWQDQRTAERVAELRALGVPISTLPSATKLEWWLDQPGPVADAARRGTLRLGTPDAWLTDRLTGGRAFVTDPSSASATGLLSLESGDWAPGALGLFSVPREALPALVPTAGAVGETGRDLLGAPVLVAARAGDQQAAAFAQGAHAPGQAKLTLGTSAMLDVHTDGLEPAPPPGSYALSLWRLTGSGDHYGVEGTVITAGAVVEWLVEIGILTQPADLDRVAGSVASAEGVVCVPAFQGLGTPFMDDAARGLIGGLTRGTTAAHVARAAVDGIAQRCADLCDALAAGNRTAGSPTAAFERAVSETLPVDGGLAASDLLVQGLADVSGRPIERAAELETTALGAALLAGLGVGLLPDLPACRAVRPAATRFEPAIGAAERSVLRERWAERLERARG